jgi:pyruvate/2-oxoglutarate dehydrogenase complex dihydrolipoamide dehydrogenase (E3) component
MQSAFQFPEILTPDLSFPFISCITSDDIFQLPRPPGRTLVIGASYIAVECGGFLRGLGCDVTMIVRSRILREFDQDMAQRLAERVAGVGIKFLQPAVPTAYDREPVRCWKEREREREMILISAIDISNPSLQISS